MTFMQRWKNWATQLAFDWHGFGDHLRVIVDMFVETLRFLFGTAFRLFLLLTLPISSLILAAMEHYTAPKLKAKDEEVRRNLRTGIHHNGK